MKKTNNETYPCAYDTKRVQLFISHRTRITSSFQYKKTHSPIYTVINCSIYIIRIAESDGCTARGMIETMTIPPTLYLEI
jgi:hypothetical protein